jgi:hypothetical protein
MYGAENLFKMRHFLVILLLVFAGKSIGQSNTETPATNTNSGTTANTISTGESQMDTLQLKELEIEQKEKSEKKTKSASDYRSKAPQSLKEEGSVETKAVSQEQSKNVQAISSSFTVSKQQSSTQRTQRSPSLDQQKQMDQVVGVLEESAPESFEYHYFKYVAGNYNIELIDHLKKAEALKPANSDVQIQMAAYHLILKDSKNALVYLDKLVASTRLSKEVVQYAEDLLLSVPENGTLITHGFDDSYATAYVQLSKKIRPDVRLVSLDFLQSEKYRSALKASTYVLPTKTTIDVQYLQEFCEKNPLKAISISLTTPKEYFVPIQQHLFVAGLVFEYHNEQDYSNFFRNDQLWTGSLTKTLINNATTEKAKQLSANYLPMLLYLRKTYKQSGDEKKMKEIDAALDKVAVQSKKYDQVQKLKSSY